MTDEPQTCEYCGGPGREPGSDVEYHALDCPLITNIFPVDEYHRHLSCPCCPVRFADEEYYTTVAVDPGHPVAMRIAAQMREEYQDDDVLVVFAVCLSCAVLGYEIPDD